MQTNIGFFTYLAPAIAFLFLSVLLLLSWRRRQLATMLVVASSVSALWAALAAAASAGASFPLPLVMLFELLRTAAWCLFLLKLVEIGRDQKLVGSAYIFGAAILIVIVFFGLPAASGAFGLGAHIIRESRYIVMMALAVLGLLLVEQVYRNAEPDQRWTLRYLCFGIGATMAYDFYMYADALLLKRVDLQIWQARGLVNAMAVPMIAISVARNPSWDLRIHVSRHVVFHSFTLMGTGVYLILMAISGYFIRIYGGAWGGVVQIFFLCLTGALLLALLFSDRIRAQIRVFLSKHFFSYKYDYRQEWSRFTDALSSSETTVPERIISALGQLVHSNSGVLWLKSESGFELLESSNMRLDSKGPDRPFESLAQFLQKRFWVIDIPEYLANPGMYEELSLPEFITGRDDAWLIIPLFFGEDLMGLVLLGKSNVVHTMNWEDHDLLKVAGRQAASELAQYKFNRELLQARQFEAFNRLSAYVVHDLKNILAQQSLIVSNAEKHKHNPAFVDDMVATVKNSVARMTRLMEQMRSGMRGEPARHIDVGALLEDIVQRQSAREPRPTLCQNTPGVIVPADREQLGTVFGHIIQNAQDASGKKGQVEVSLDREGESVAVVSVRDNGIGMDDEFVRQRLFKPFDSTKGLTGMGVGAFESREYVRSLGGDIEVNSTPGAGSLFRIVLPCQTQQTGEVSG